MEKQKLSTITKKLWFVNKIFIYAETSYNAIGDLVDWLHREHYADGLEIIGNIYDNPELLK